MTIEIFSPSSERKAIAARCLTALPEWFGRPASTAAYIEGAGSLPMLAARIDGETVGFASLRDERETLSTEIVVIGVLPTHHRQGVGRLLVDGAVGHCIAAGSRHLLVSTLGPSHPDPHYARTRAFYRAMGFVELGEELDAWGPGTPALRLERTI